ncbi:hypothetical protein [Ferruginibacter sp.]
MFKQFTAIFLLTAFLAQTFTGSLIRLDYYANTAAYAKNCINKARPKLHCNGKCQAMKKMQEEEKKEQDNTERKYAGKTNVLSSKSFFYSTQNRPFSFIDQSPAIEIAYPLCDISYSFFHPPQA